MVLRGTIRYGLRRRLAQIGVLPVFFSLLGCGPPGDDDPPVNSSADFINGGAPEVDVSGPMDLTIELSASDDGGVTHFLLSELPEPSNPKAGDERWERIPAPATVVKTRTTYRFDPCIRRDATLDLYVWFKDTADQVSVGARDRIRIARADTEAPTNLSGDFIKDEVATSVALTLHAAAEDNVAVTGVLIQEAIGGAEPPRPTGQEKGWEQIGSQTPYSAELPFTLDPADARGVEIHTVYLWFRDALCNISDPAVDTVELVTDGGPPPTNPHVVINGGAEHTDSIAVLLTVSARDDQAVEAVLASEDGTEPEPTDLRWELFSPPSPDLHAELSFTFAGGPSCVPEVRTVYVWFRDNEGKVSDRAEDSIVLDRLDCEKPGSPSVLINGGAASTRSPQVVLELSATDNVAVEMYFASQESRTPLAEGPGWKPVASPGPTYAQEVDFTLTGPAPCRAEERTVHVWFQDAAGNVSDMAKDAIVLDGADKEAPLPMSMAINGGSTMTDNPRVTVAVSAADLVGVGGVLLSESGAPPTPADPRWRAIAPPVSDYSAELSFDLTPGAVCSVEGRSVYAWFRDDCGNTAGPLSETIDLRTTDAEAPVHAGVLINGGASRTTTLDVTLTLSADDPGKVAMFLARESPSRPALDDTQWRAIDPPVVNYRATVPFDFAPGPPGLRTVNVWFRDACNNIAGPAADSIEIDPGRNALCLDGIDARAEAASSIFPNTAAASFTAEAWVCPGSAGSVLITDDAFDMILFFDPAAANGGVGIKFSLYRTCVSTTSIVEFRDIKLRQWNHVAVMFEAPRGAMTVAINGRLGQPSAFVTAGFCQDPGFNFTVGGIFGTDEGAFEGKIDAVRISDIVRYGGNFDPPSPTTLTPDGSTMGLWLFDEPEGSTIFSDSSAFGRPLTGRGGARTCQPTCP